MIFDIFRRANKRSLVFKNGIAALKKCRELMDTMEDAHRDYMPYFKKVTTRTEWESIMETLDKRLLQLEDALRNNELDRTETLLDVTLTQQERAYEIFKKAMTLAARDEAVKDDFFKASMECLESTDSIIESLTYLEENDKSVYERLTAGKNYEKLKTELITARDGLEKTLADNDYRSCKLYAAATIMLCDIFKERLDKITSDDE